MMMAVCEICLKYRNRSKDFMQMFGLVRTMDQSAMANSVLEWSCSMERG